QPLNHSKSMLLVDDHKAEFLEYRVFLNQRVRSYNDLSLSGRNLFQESLFLSLLDSSANHTDLIVQRAKYSASIDVMLFRKNFGGCHDCSLVTILDGDYHTFESDNRFSASNIALQQTIHGMLRLHVAHDFLQHALLRRRWMKWQDRFHLLADRIGGL